MRRILRSIAVVSVLATLGSSAAVAQPTAKEPASVLFFPLYDAGPAAQTAITVTNTNLADDPCPGDPGPLEGEILAAFIYFDPERNVLFERPELLTPGDTLTVIASQHNPEGQRGYVMIVARNPTTFPNPQANVDFDWLAGSALVVQADRDAVWSYHPYAFRAIAQTVDPCQRSLTDFDGDGVVDFDNAEYVGFPRELLIPAFFEEIGPFENSVVLVSTIPFGHRPELRYRLRNNAGFLRADTVLLDGAWWTGSLAEIAPDAADLTGRTLELGRPPVETGWIAFRGRRTFDPSGNPVEDLVPPLVGVFRERIRSRDLETGFALDGTGAMDGREGPNGNGE